MERDLILVIGASGSVGSELVRILRADGYGVRTATSRIPKDDSSVHVNLTTGEGVAQAFEGVDKAFLISPSGYAEQDKILSPLIQEAKRRDLKKVVLMTALGANVSDAIPLRRAEIELETSGLKYNIIRPNWFMQNFNTYWIHGINTQRKIVLPVGDAKTSFIDTRDISAVAAKLLTTDRFDNRDFDLTGPEDLTHAEVAQAMSEIIGEKVTFEDGDPSVLKKDLRAAGLTEDYASLLLSLLSYVKAGYNAGVKPTVKEILGRDPISFKKYLLDNRRFWP